MLTASSSWLCRCTQVAGLAIVCFLITIWAGCGEYYRPVAYPLTPPQPSPGFSHVALVITANGTNNPGASTTIDVSGDTAISQSSVGLLPTYAALVDNATKVYVANSAEDSVSEFAPFSATPVSTIGLPAGSAPNFVASTETTTVYVGNFGSGTVSAISITNNVLTNTIPVGGSPASMAEIPNGQKLYVANGATATGNGSVVSINTLDQSVNLPIVANPIAPWVSPIWVVSRSDSQRAYVLDKGSGFVSAINTDFDTVVGTPASVGVGADFMAYDPTLNRLYVTNPASNTVVALDASTDSLNAMTASIANPISVAALPDGTRAYVASAAISGTAPNQTVSSHVTVLNAADLSVKATVPLSSVPVLCATKTWSELSMAAAADSSRVYIGNCDAANTDVIQTSNDTLLLQIPAPFGQSPTVHITAALLNGSNTTYTYSLISGLPLKIGMSIAITGMANAANNGTFTVTALGAGTFTVVNASGVTANNQAGTGVVSAVPPPSQTPVFVLAGP
jgi:YVTN family beta-propeller protein